MEVSDWRNRYKSRNDISSRLTHLTKGNTSEEAFDTLIDILNMKKIKGSTSKTGFIVGKKPAVCFQEAPLGAIAENLQYEKKIKEDTNCKVRYDAFGLRFNKEWIYKKGGRPVIYEEKELMKKILPKDEHWRIVNYDLHDKQHIIDWTHEREWRVPGDIDFEYGNIEVLVSSKKFYQRLIDYCIINRKLDMLRKIKGIIVLDTIYY